jgi:hypothetical protein
MRKKRKRAYLIALGIDWIMLCKKDNISEIIGIAIIPLCGT